MKYPEKSSHITPTGGNVFSDLGFGTAEAAELQAQSRQIITEKLATKGAGEGNSLAENRQQENKKAAECWNEFVEKNGLPLAKYRGF